jgi:hypothetical protein
MAHPVGQIVHADVNRTTAYGMLDLRACSNGNRLILSVDSNRFRFDVRHL